MSRDRTVAVVIEIVVIPDIKRRSRIRIPAEQKLSARIFPQSVVIDAQFRKQKPRKLIRRAERKDVRIESDFFVVVSTQTAFRIIERKS